MTNLNKEEKLIEFISFCIENYKVKYGLNGKEASELFKEKGVLRFLTEGYEILHTQDKDYIIDEIQMYIKNRSENI